MRKIYLLFLLFILCFELNGQWYKEKYGVNDINQLSKVQLEESLHKANTTGVIGLGSFAIGIVCTIVGAVYLDRANHPGEYGITGFLAGLDEGVKAACCFTGGTIGIGAGLGLMISSGHRSKMIKPVLQNYNKENRLINISPAIIVNGPQSYKTGFVLSVKF